MGYVLIAATPLFLLVVGLVIARARKLNWAEDVGFRAPKASAAFVWVTAFVAFAVAIEVLGSGGESARGSWVGKYSAADLAIRMVAVGLLYPIAEEFFFRGVFLGALRRRFGDLPAIIVPAIVFGAIHVQYDWPLLIVADGLLFGLARVRTGSVYVPMAMHVIGNSYAVWERLQ